MDDTTELIQALARQVVTVVKQSLSRVPDPQATAHLAWIGTALRDVLRQVGAEALGQWLSSAQPTPEAERACACGANSSRGRKPATIALSGWRAILSCCRCWPIAGTKTNHSPPAVLY